MKSWLKILLLSGLLFNHCEVIEAKDYCLSDPKTQLPVLKCELPEGWAGYGKVQWTSSPENPATWYYCLINSDGSRLAQGSSFNSVVPTPINNCHFFVQPQMFATSLIAQFSKDYGVNDLKLVSATAKDFPNGTNHPIFVAQYQNTVSRGVPVSAGKIVDFEATYSGTKNGKPYKIIANIPIIGMQIHGVTSVNFLTSYSIGASADKIESVRNVQSRVNKTFVANPGFQLFVTQISNQRTMDYIKHQNEIFDMINETNKNSQNSIEYARGLWNDYINDLEVVDNPNGGKIKVDFRHDHAAINSNNEVIYYENGLNIDEIFPPSEWKKIK